MTRNAMARSGVFDRDFDLVDERVELQHSRFDFFDRRYLEFDHVFEQFFEAIQFLIVLVELV